MDNLTKMYDVACKEVGVSAERGLNVYNLDMVYKLVDIMKDIKTIQAMENGTYHNEYETIIRDSAVSVSEPILDTLKSIDDYFINVKENVLKMTLNAEPEVKNKVRQHLADILSSF